MPHTPILASALKKSPHIVAYDELCFERFSGFELEKLLVTMFDTVDASLLDTLAAQYDMLGYNGWVLAENDQEKRELLKGAVGLHKMMGTAGGIREVVQRLGFEDIIIEEGWENFTDGSAEPPVNPWAYFRVVYVLPAEKAINDELAQNLIGLVNNYKNARSVLANFGFGINFEENIGILDEVEVNVINV